MSIINQRHVFLLQACHHKCAIQTLTTTHARRESITVMAVHAGEWHYAPTSTQPASRPRVKLHVDYPTIEATIETLLAKNLIKRQHSLSLSSPTRRVNMHFLVNSHFRSSLIQQICLSDNSCHRYPISPISRVNSLCYHGSHFTGHLTRRPSRFILATITKPSCSPYRAAPSYPTRCYVHIYREESTQVRCSGNKFRERPAQEPWVFGVSAPPS